MGFTGGAVSFPFLFLYSQHLIYWILYALRPIPLVGIYLTHAAKSTIKRFIYNETVAGSLSLIVTWGLRSVYIICRASSSLFELDLFRFHL